MNRAGAVAELKDTFSILVDDIEKSRSLGGENPTDFARRTLIRTHFSFIEGITYQLRQVALAWAQPEIFSTSEIVALKEETYSLDQKGEIEVKNSFHRFLPSILFSIRSYARVHGSDFKPDTSQQGWDQMQKYKKIRDRLVHPKASSELSLTDDDLQVSIDAATWIKDTLSELFAACEEADG